jgi:hypothetical protein
MYTYACVDLPSTLTSCKPSLIFTRWFWYQNCNVILPPCTCVYQLYIRFVKISKAIFHKASRSPGRWNLVRTLTPHRRSFHDYCVRIAENIMRNMAYCHPLKRQFRGYGPRNHPCVFVPLLLETKREGRICVKNCNLKAYDGCRLARIRPEDVCENLDA